METALSCEPTSARSARRLTAEELTRCGCAELVDVAELLVSELVTNVVLHARTELRLRVITGAVSVRVEVADASPRSIDPRAHPDEATTGRGLMLIDALAQRWGSELLPSGKVVWFELDRPAA